MLFPIPTTKSPEAFLTKMLCGAIGIPGDDSGGGTRKVCSISLTSIITRLDLECVVEILFSASSSATVRDSRRRSSEKEEEEVKEVWMEVIDQIEKKTQGSIREVLAFWAEELAVRSEMGVAATSSTETSAAGLASATISTLPIDEDADQEAAALFSEVDESRREKRLLKLLVDSVKDRGRFKRILEEYSELSARVGGEGRLSGRGTVLEEIVDAVVEMTMDGEPVYFARRLHNSMEVCVGL